MNKNLQMELVVADSLRFYWEQVAVKSDNLYLMEAQKFEQLSGINKSLQVAIEEEKKKSRKIVIGVGVGSTLLGVLLGVLLGK